MNICPKFTYTPPKYPLLLAAAAAGIAYVACEEKTSDEKSVGGFQVIENETVTIEQEELHTPGFILPPTEREASSHQEKKPEVQLPEP